MLLMLMMLAVAVATAVGIALLIIGWRHRQRRRLSRARREGDYAERQSTWSTYVGMNKSRRIRKLTDQSQPGD
jgi:Flp pilus assembly protein TadB